MTSPFDPLSFSHGPPMRNRFVLAPLTNQQSHPDGTLSDAERNWLTMRARGGFGMTITAAAHVQQCGRAFPGQLGICDDDQIDGLTRLAVEVRAAGSLAIIQLHHGGNRVPAGLNDRQPVCPSDDPEHGARGLTTAEVEQLRDDFVAAAVRADRAGFDGIELHGAHGYVICQFLSAEINRRDDRYGGTLENRSRLLFEIIDGVRSSCRPDFHVAVRLSPERFGMLLDEVIDVYDRIVADGNVDVVDMSLWDVSKEPVEAAYAGRTLTAIFAERPRSTTRLGVAGRIHDPADVQWVLDAGVDVVMLGRVAILHHDYPELLRGDEGFIPRRIPVTESVLRDEGLSDAFVDYMRNWQGFVASRPGAEAHRRMHPR